ncbi:extracellular ribonuclease LE-like [Prunus avium]|uniref:Extracellular ribonuclease LE-like n=2 Tax=Prunus avium TaxID=42229 RepID=A0A6P5RPH5_PRUAV|nr:extracellular ribonuclease LE-like [Prunus avium]
MPLIYEILAMLKLLLLVLFSAASLQAITTHGQPYDYLQYVLQWPNTKCVKARCIPGIQKTEFTTHGLWPTNLSKILTCNSASKFSSTMLQNDATLVSKLKTSWPNLEQRVAQGKDNDMWFWAMEYEKHGTCAKFSSQNTYLSKACDLWEENKIKDIFAKHKIIPRNATYKDVLLTNAIQMETRSSPLLLCHRVNGGDLLWEVVLCYDDTAKKRMNCSDQSARQTNCGTDIYYKFINNNNNNNKGITCS